MEVLLCMRMSQNTVRAITGTAKKGFITRSAGLPPTRLEPVTGKTHLLNDPRGTVVTTDKELLESAVKAAGLTHLTYCEPWNCMAVFNNAGGYFEWDTYWNSARSPKDAMSLITRLQLCVQGHDTGVTVSNPKGTILINVEYNSGSDSDKTAALLLAITRTAAAIGNTL